MHHSTKHILPLLFCMFSTLVFSQKQRILQRRCATMEVLQNMIDRDPSLIQQWQQEGERKQKAYQQKNSAARETFSAGTIVVPVVVHIVTNNPNSISDRDVLEQIEQLNLDFAGQNADSAVLLPEFKSRFGHTNIRFTMARKAPDNSFTSGIERKTITTSYNSNNYNNVKHVSSGGLDAWDPNRYYNVWVANFSNGLLGIATFPYMTPVNEQGVVINNFAFGLNACHVMPEFNLGRTLVHETGHYFYLYHIWGDDDGACTGSDFRIQTGYSLPAACTDDTPNQADQTNGYRGGYSIDSCSAVRPGVMYQNYMDYTNDVSYGLFTNSQVCRMQNALDMYRSSLKSTDGAAIAANTNDAYLVSLQPGGGKCSVVPVVCQGTPLTATLRNSGSTTINSLTFRLQLDGTAATPFNWSGSLAPGHDTLVNLGVLNVTGNHTLTVYTSSPNGTADAYRLNDTLVKQVSITAATLTAPFTEGFDNTAFPPPGWSISNPDNSIFAWSRTAAAHTGAGAAYVDNYNDSLTGQWDDLVTPQIDFGNADSASLSFWVAYRAYADNDNTPVDGLEVWLSNDCGGTYVPLYRKGAPDLSTASVANSALFTPTPAQWRQEVINLRSYLVPNQKIILLFRNVNGFGNRLYIDDVNIGKYVFAQNDAAVARITAPGFVCTGNTLNASVTIRNTGLANLQQLNISYAIDNGTATTLSFTGNLAKGDSANIALPVLSASIGQHSLKVFATLPNGVADGNNANDTLKTDFAIIGASAAPLRESFENNGFPPTGWGIYNPDAGITWKTTRRATTLSSSADATAIYLNGFNYGGSNNIDEMRSPVIQYSNADSVFLLFDLAATFNSLGSSNFPTDTLEVLLTSDCGGSFQSVYKKFGDTLKTATTPSSATEFFPASSAQYRRDSVNLTAWVPATGSFQVVFRSTSNNRNNIYLDNVNVYTKTLPAKLKQQGYLVYPSPFRQTFIVQHLRQPTNLRGLSVFSTGGAKVYARQYNGDAPSLINLNLSNVASGVYLVELVYSDHTITERVLKTP